MMPTITIIGCGWMGWPCARHLIEAGYSVRGSTTSKDKLSLLKREGIQAVMLNLDADEIPIDLFQCDILFITFPPGRGAENLVVRYQKRIDKVIKAARNAKLKKIIYASTTGVYAGHGNHTHVDENTMPAPLRKSAQAMYEAEQSLAQYTDQLTILRFGGLVGGQRKSASFFAGKTNIPNPHNVVNLVHLDDCVAIVKTIIEQDIFGYTFNVVADQHPERKTYYTHRASMAGQDAPTFTAQSSTPNKLVLNEKLKKKLDYQFIYPDPNTFPV